MGIDPQSLLCPKRQVTGVSAVLLPFTEQGQVDWDAFAHLLQQTLTAGLTPAVNMDTGYVNLLDERLQDQVLEATSRVAGGARFVAGAFVADAPGQPFARDAYARRIAAINNAGGVPVIFQSYGLAHQPEPAVIGNYEQIATLCDEFIGFELGEMFAPFGRIYSLEVFEALMKIPQCSGAKHSSLRREPEWERLALRNALRPGFRVYTGNDLAIDMVIYGSDYLLGLSSFAPDAFAKRDALWSRGDAAWNGWNDLLQYLGFLAFRAPVPAYKHSAALFLNARGWIPCSRPHPDALSRSPADESILRQIAEQVDAKLQEAQQ